MTTRNDIEQLFRSNYRTLLAFAVRTVHDESAARDIVHDVFANLLSENSFTPTAAYLAAAVRNRCVNHLRNLTTRQRIVGLYALECSAAENHDRPDDATIEQLSDIIAQKLSERTRCVLEMRFTAGMSYKAIAAQLGISEVAVYKHLRHAIDVLRKNLSDYD